MLHSNFIILIIVIPLISGIFCFLSSKKIAWSIVFLTSIFCLAISAYFFRQTFDGTNFYYNLGGWNREIGIEYKLNKLGCFFSLLTSFIFLLNNLGLRKLINNEVNESKQNLFFGLTLLSLAAMQGICISNDIFNIFVLLEINAISNYALVASRNSKTSAKAAFDYLIFGTIGSTFILFGIGFIYSICGTLNLTIITEMMPEILENNAVRGGLLLLMIGFLMKAALFPISGWLVDVYQGAPSFVSSLLSATSNKIGIYLVINFYFNIFQVGKANLPYNEISLSIIAFLAIIFSGYFALKQTNIKRFLAYSSLSQIGFIIFTLIIGSNQAFTGALIYCLTHALEKTTLFLASGYLLYYVRSETIDDFSGIIKKYPLLSVIILINLLSTVGFPLTAGFVGKWQIFKASLETDMWFVFMVMFASLFTFSYAFKFAEVLVFEKNSQNYNENIASKTIPYIIIFTTGLNLFLGFNSQILLSLW